jgi:hypothetical protein
MRLAIISWLLLLAMCGPLHAQVSLKEGETWVYHFDKLDYLFTQSGSNNYAALSFRFRNFTDFSTGSVLRCEMFEGAPSTTPFASNVLSSPLTNLTFTLAAPDRWTNFDGSVRLTMVSGSAHVGGIGFMVSRPSTSGTQSEIYIAPISLVYPVRISLTNEIVQVSWSTNRATYYVLQTSDGVAPADWHTVNDNGVVSNGLRTVTLETNGLGRQFFRVAQ